MKLHHLHFVVRSVIKIIYNLLTPRPSYSEIHVPL